MVSVGVVDEGAKAVGGVMVTAMPAVGINPGEGFHVVADACCDSGERFAGVELGARIPVAQVVESDLACAGNSRGQALEGLCEPVW